MTALQPYPAYKDSGAEWLGRIPAHWDVAALRYRYEQSLGKMLDTKQITGEHLVPYLRNVDVQWDRINVRGLPHMDIRPHEIDRFTVRPGDLLVCEGGETGRCAIWHGEVDPCGYQKALHRLRPLDRVRDNPRFLYYTFATAVTRGAFADGQGSTIGHLTGDMLRAHRFPFPQPSEQPAIADFLDQETARIDALLARQERLNELLEEEKQAIIHQAITGQIDVRTGQPYPAYKDSGIDWLEGVPEHWEVRWLGTFGRFFKGSGGTKADETDEGIPCVRYGDLYTRHQFHITESKACVAPHRAGAYTPVRYGDVLFAGSGETLDEIGKSAVNLIRRSAVCGGDVIVFRPTIDVDAEFIGWSTDCRQAAFHKARMGRGMTVMHIYSSDLKRLAVPLPPLPEQTAVVRFLDRADGRIRRHVSATERQIALLREYRTRLIADVVTGKLDVREAAANLPDADPAEGTNRGGTNDAETHPDATEHDIAEEAGA